jgi:hypothetical protein
VTAPTVDLGGFVGERRPGHPDWCAQDHSCTAATGGEHASDQLVWETAEGRVIVTRYQRVGADPFVEVRHVLRLRDESEAVRERRLRVLVAVSERLLREVVRWRV